MSHSLSDPNTWPAQYGDVLYRHAYFRLRDEMAAEELVQETFLAALKARERFAGRSSEKTWLVGILKHKIMDQLRKSMRERPHEDEIQSVETLIDESFDGKGHWKIDIGCWSSPHNSLEQQQFWQVMEQCVAALPKRLATLFILRELDGLESEAICKEMALSSTNNLWTMLSRMRMRLRQCLDIRWFNRNTV